MSYNATVAFSPKSDARIVKLGHSQVLDIRRHWGEEPRTPNFGTG